MKESIMLVLGILIVISIVFAIMGLIWWGIGCFVIWAFGINYSWTYLHGVATALIISASKNILSITVKKGD